MTKKIRLLVIGGPTGAGKSEAAVRVARKIDGEIISADSVQVYKYFDIGSGKPPVEAREGIPHHLLDFLEPDRQFSMWDFKEKASALIDEIKRRGKTPIIVGGTGLYIKALLENLEGGVPSERDMRQSLLESVKTEGSDALYRWLIRLDPSASAGIHPNDTHRIIRGIENALLKERKNNAPRRSPSPYRATFFVLSGPRADVYRKINSRAERMLEKGWIKETENIMANGYNEGCKPLKSVGYRQIVEYLKGRLEKEKLLEEIQKQTRRYAKRQITWFNSVKEAVWINSVSREREKELEKIADYIAEKSG